jgi:hypothetical protein
MRSTNVWKIVLKSTGHAILIAFTRSMSGAPLRLQLQALLRFIPCGRVCVRQVVAGGKRVSPQPLHSMPGRFFITAPSPFAVTEAVLVPLLNTFLHTYANLSKYRAML